MKSTSTVNPATVPRKLYHKCVYQTKRSTSTTNTVIKPHSKPMAFLLQIVTYEAVEKRIGAKCGKTMMQGF